MGVVYMAEQTEPVERRVALKIIKPGMDTKQVISRFEAERQALAMMDHPNIARVLDAGTTDSGRPYFVMELVKGIPVTQYCDQEHLSVRERLELFVPICQAIQHAHQKGIIHRDVKPTNILVARYDGKPMPKVIDFGVAKATSQRLTEKTMFTQYGQIVGTIEYMSPEQAEFNQLDIDTRSDIYSLGVLLYELLTGETPFDKQRLHSAAFDELLRIIREEEPPRPSTKLSSSQSLPNTAVNRKIEPKKLSLLVRGELDWIVMKALEKDRNRRYETATSFAADIQHYLNDEAVVACPPSTAYRFRKFARRNKVAFGTTAAIALSLLVGTSVATWQAIRATKAEHDAQAFAEDAAKQASRASDAEAAARVEAERANEQAARADIEADKARSEAAIASAIRDFLQQDLLGMADADSLLAADMTPDPNVKLRTVVDRAAERIDEHFGDQPLVEAPIRQTLGSTYLRLGQYEQAERHRRRACEIYDRELPPEHPVRLVAILGLAAAVFRQGQYSEAEAMFREVLEVRLHMLGPEHPTTLLTMTDLAIAINWQGRDAEAEAKYREVLQVMERVLGPEHRTTLLTMFGLARAINHQGRHVEAEAKYREVLEVYERVLGPEHPTTLLTMTNLANAMNGQGRHVEAEAKLREVLEVQDRVLGPEHPNTLTTMLNLANAMNHQGRHAEAEAMDREIFEVQERTLGREHPMTLTTMRNLATTIDQQDRHREAATFLREAIEPIVETTDVRRELAACQNVIANALLDTGDAAGAVDAFRKANELCEDEVGQVNYGRALMKIGQVDAAIDAFRQSVAFFERKLDEAPDDAAAKHNLRAACLQLVPSLRAQGRSDEALTYLHRAQQLGASDDRFWMEYALCHRALGHDAEYEHGCEQLITGYPPADERSVADWGHVSQTLYGLGKYREAREGLEKTIELRRDEGPTLKGGPRWWYYTLTLCRLGEMEQARTNYDRLSQLMTDEPPPNPRVFEELQAEAAELLGLNRIPETNLGSVDPDDPSEE